MSDKPERLDVSVQDALKFQDWIQNRGGIAVWRSVNLSNPGASWATPALTEGKPTPKPNWQAGNTPERIVTDASEVDVYEAKEHTRFHVAVKRGDSANFTLTTGSSRKLRRAVANAGEGAFYEFDYETQEAVIMKSKVICTLAQYLAQRTGA